MESAKLQIPNGKAKLRRDHVKHKIAEEMVLESTTPLMDNFSQKDVINFL